ncbi:MAG: cardiolipin synthase [Phycisphaerales bacterium]|nr:cardiolipin synthase [Phycisphaerales bacterium]
MGTFGWLTEFTFLTHWALVLILTVRIVAKRHPVSVSLAWFLILFFVPYIGAIAYLVIGEHRLGARRAARAQALAERSSERIRHLDDAAPLDPATLGPTQAALQNQGRIAVGFPAVGGNALELIGDCEKTLHSIIADIDAARHTCHIVMYIWSEGGLADDVAEALLRAATRGVACRLLLDDVGSNAFLNSARADRLRAGGVQIVAALPVGVIRALFVRVDLRVHRKIIVIDGRVAYTGSMNIADARFFKVHAGVGPWVDAMVRIEGPAVMALGLAFLLDWELETGESVETLVAQGVMPTCTPCGSSIVQVVPSGPGPAPDAIHEMLMTTLYAARRELVMTTPYFVPDESTLTAMASAAHRGVEVTIVVPARIDSRLAQYAGCSHYDTLLSAGVRICQYRSGLLHAKTISVDGEIGLIGSMNLDMRSLWLDFEVTLFVYDHDFTTRLRLLQAQYIAEGDPLDLAAWRRRLLRQKCAENVARLASPLL